MSAALIHASVGLLRDLQNPEEQYSTRGNEEQCSARHNTECTPVVVKATEYIPTTTNDAEGTPTAPAHAWRYTAMSAAAFTLSALLGYIATEAICKRGRGCN